MSGIEVISFNADGTYTIIDMVDMNDADAWAERHTNQVHYLNIDGGPHVLEWAGPSPDHPRWIETNEPQSKTALLLLLLE